MGLPGQHIIALIIATWFDDRAWPPTACLGQAQFLFFETVNIIPMHPRTEFFFDFFLAVPVFDNINNQASTFHQASTFVQ